MEEMTAKQRLLAAMRGQQTDRVPWAPFLAYYWDFVDPETARQGQFSFLRQLGADPLLRGFHRLFQVRRNRCEVHDTTRGNMRTVTYETPVGILREEYTFAPVSRTWFLTKHPVACEEQVKTLQFICENTEIVPDSAGFEADRLLYGEEALLLPAIGTQLKTSYQSMVEHWLGTQELAYALQDYPQAVQECLAVMNQRDMETVEVSLASNAEGFIFWEDSSTTNTSPAMFAQYAVPAINAWGEKIHAQGKLLVHHACGHIKDLLPLMANTAIDAIESVSPPPTGNVEIAQAFAALPPQIALIGGIEPTLLLSSTLPELEQTIQQLLQTAKGRRFILANSDSCPPYVERAKFLLVSELVRRPR